MKLTTNLKDQIANDFVFALSTVGEQVTVNSQPQQVLISAKKPSENYDGLTISSLAELKTGDIIEYQDKKYLAISEVPVSRKGGIFKSLLRHLPFTIAINCSCDFVTVPCFFDSKTYDVTGKYVPIAEGTILATIPATPNTSKIKLDDRFIKLGGAWKVVGIDRTKPGLITLTCDKDTVLPEDDMPNELAGVGACQITITTEPVELEVGQTLQIEWTGVQDVTFTSSNEDVATVDQNGLVTAISAGTFTITVSSAYASDSITLTVAEPLPTTVEITGDDTIRVGLTATYTTEVEVSWKLTNEDGTATSYASIDGQTATTCTVKAGQTANKKVKLTATLLANSSITGEKIITTRPLF